MVGNDIIDLKLAKQQSNLERPRFLNKLFTQGEQQFILDSSNPFERLWLLWSMKESAYKIYIQQGGSRIFAPIKFESTMKSATQGFVMFDNSSYQTASVITSGFIHTISLFGKFDVNSQIIPLKNSSAKAQRFETYRLLKRNIARQRNLNFEYLEIKKTLTGIPKLYYKNSLLDVFFSLSHHGKYGAITFI